MVFLGWGETPAVTGISLVQERFAACSPSFVVGRSANWVEDERGVEKGGYGRGGGKKDRSGSRGIGMTYTLLLLSVSGGFVSPEYSLVFLCHRDTSIHCAFRRTISNASMV